VTRQSTRCARYGREDGKPYVGPEPLLDPEGVRETRPAQSSGPAADLGWKWVSDVGLVSVEVR